MQRVVQKKRYSAKECKIFPREEADEMETFGVAFLRGALQKTIEFSKIVRITDIIDIAIMAFLIYKLLMMARRNQSGRVLKGIVLWWNGVFWRSLSCSNRRYAAF